MNVLVQMFVRGYESEGKWMFLFRYMILCVFCINIARKFEFFLLFLANLNEILIVVFFFLEFLLLAMFSILLLRRGNFFVFLSLDDLIFFFYFWPV